MDLNQIKEIVKKLHAGASYVVVYQSKAATLDGLEAIKLTKKPCRLGVRYGHLKHMLGQTPQALPGNGHWVLDKYVYEDANGLKLRITNGAFGKAKSTYSDAAGNKIDADRIVHKAGRSFQPIVQCIKLENVVAIEKKGEAL